MHLHIRFVFNKITYDKVVEVCDEMVEFVNKIFIFTSSSLRLSATAKTHQIRTRFSTNIW